MRNHDVYGQYAQEHAERTRLENLSDNFKSMLKRFHKMTREEDILEVGCANGRDIRYLHQSLNRESHSYGLDASEDMICLARDETESENIEYLVGDMERIPFSDNKFGGIWSQATIFMTDLQGMKNTLSEFSRVLSDGGIGAVSFKLEDSQSSENGRQIRSRWGEDVEYFFVDRNISSSIVQDSGMVIEDSEISEFKGTVFLNIWFRNS